MPPTSSSRHRRYRRHAKKRRRSVKVSRTIGEAARFDFFLSSLGDVGLIEDDAPELLVGGQNADQQRAVAAADVHHRVEARKVVGVVLLIYVL